MPVLGVVPSFSGCEAELPEGVLVVRSLEDAYGVLVSWVKLIDRPWPALFEWEQSTIWNACVEARDKTRAAEPRKGAA